MRTILALIVVLVGGGFLLWKGLATAPENVGDYRNATYIIEGERVQLVDGEAEVGSVITQAFGNEASADLTGDSIPDVAFILAQQPGGTGTFYYIAVARGVAGGGYEGTNALLLGDRIAPQTTEIRNGTIIVNYADRRPDEPMTADPTVGVSRTFRMESGTLKEVTQ
ncbi:MAG: hypothetical protein AAB463_01055 [Patescibacteria group bacterium]